MALLSLLTLLYRWRKRGVAADRKMMWAWLISGPIGLVALEAGGSSAGDYSAVDIELHAHRGRSDPDAHLAAPFWTFTLIITSSWASCGGAAQAPGGRHATGPRRGGDGPRREGDDAHVTEAMLGFVMAGSIRPLSPSSSGGLRRRVWDLFASTAHQNGATRRCLIARAMGPVWEVNHVWLSSARC